MLRIALDRQQRFVHNAASFFVAASAHIRSSSVNFSAWLTCYKVKRFFASNEIKTTISFGDCFEWLGVAGYSRQILSMRIFKPYNAEKNDQ